MKSGKLPYRPKAANPEVEYRLPADGLWARPLSKAAKALSYSASELLKGWRKVWPAALCRGSQACGKVGEKRAMFPSGIAFTFLHIARKPLIVKEFCSTIAIHVFFTQKSANPRRYVDFVSIKQLNALIVQR